MKKILYVEDNEDVANAAKLILSDGGYSVELANCGKDGLKKAKKGFDLILLDIMLPDTSGWAIFEKLKKECRSHFVFVSAIPISNERLYELKKEGLSDYLTKPFTKKDLLECAKKFAKSN